MRPFVAWRKPFSEVAKVVAPVIASVPVAVRLPPRKVLPATSRAFDRVLVPIPTPLAVTVSVGVAAKPTWNVDAVGLVNDFPRAKALLAVADTSWPIANEACPVAVRLALWAYPIARDPKPVDLIEFPFAARPKANEAVLVESMDC